MRGTSVSTVFALGLGLLLSAAAHAAGPPIYSVTELDGIDRATDVNNNGDVVGWTNSGNAVLLFRGVQQVILPSLGGRSVAKAINDLGQVVGKSALGGADNPTYHAFLYSGGETQDLGTLEGFGGASGANDINDKGQVVGWSTLDSKIVPFIYSRGQMTLIPALDRIWGGVSAVANAINDRGRVVGTLEALESDGDPPTVTTVFVSSPRGGIGLLGGLGGHSRRAADINALGVIVGAAETSLTETTTHAFLYRSGMTDLNPTGGESSAASVNKTGHVVGYFVDGDGHRRGFLYFSDWMYDLNERLVPDAGWFIKEAISINDNGQIVADACPGSTTCATGVPVLLNPVVTRGRRP